MSVDRIEENRRAVQRRIAAACKRSGRKPEDVTLVAVTKMVTAAEIAELYRLGVRDFGENRVADGAAHKSAVAADGARWHLIGHLQRNKAAEALQAGFLRIHSVESEKLIEVLDRECGKLGVRAEILLEVNVSGEESKYGVSPENLPALAKLAAAAPHLAFSGLMTMAPFTDAPENSRPHFRRLAALRGEMSALTGCALPHVSMGMTGDFEVAVEEGATLVRVGTALFA